MIDDIKLENKIGFDEVRAILKNTCLSTLGKEWIDTMHYMTKCEEISFELSCVREYLTILQDSTPFPSTYYIDLRPVLVRIKPDNTYLIEAELFDFKRSLDTYNNILAYLNKTSEDTAPPTLTHEEDTKLNYRYTTLRTLVQDCESFLNLSQQITKVIDDYGHIKDNASPTLCDIRERIASTERSISGTINQLLRQAQAEGYVDKDAAPTVRDGRLVIPIIPAAKRRIRGIVHDESATGKTLFVEPEQIVEANNQIRSLQAAERREIIRILQQLTTDIRPHLPALMQAYALLGRFDSLRAKALFTIKYKGDFPHFVTHPAIDWYGAQHPLLSRTLAKHGKAVVPLDISLQPTQHIVLISGPNAGGKSVCLKTVGLLQYMWQCGLPVPMKAHSTIGLFEALYIDIGDEQSIENELSTYSSHLTNMKYMLRRATNQSLLLVDEFGGGTEPLIGGAMAEAILSQWVAMGVYGIITTHYQNLKVFADHHDTVVNAAMLYDRQQMQPLFKLQLGTPGSSFAIEIARKIGLPETVIAHAATLVGQDYMASEKYLQDILRDKKYWENKRTKIKQQEKQLEQILAKHEADITQLKQQRKDIIASAQTQAEKLLQAANAKIEHTIKEIRETQAEKEHTKKLRSHLKTFGEAVQQTDIDEQNAYWERKAKQISERQKRRAEKKEQPHPAPGQKQRPTTTVTSTTRPLQVGDAVNIKGQQAIGIIQEIGRKDIKVRLGMMLMTVKTSLVTHSKQPAPSPSKVHQAATFVSEATSKAMYEKKLHFRPDIDVRGMRIQEALTAVSYFMDEATMVGVSRVRILHGTGTGALRQAIRDYLHTIPAATHVRDEHVQFGGAGITVVEMD